MHFHSCFQSLARTLRLFSGFKNLYIDISCTTISMLEREEANISILTLQSQNGRKKKWLPQDIQRGQRKVKIDVLTLDGLNKILLYFSLEKKSSTVLIHHVYKWPAISQEFYSWVSKASMQNPGDSLKAFTIKVWYQRWLSHTIKYLHQ